MQDICPSHLKQVKMQFCHRVCVVSSFTGLNPELTTDDTNGVQAGTAYSSGAPRFTRTFSTFRVAGFCFGFSFLLFVP